MQVAISTSYQLNLSKPVPCSYFLVRLSANKFSVFYYISFYVIVTRWMIFIVQLRAYNHIFRDYNRRIFWWCRFGYNHQNGHDREIVGRTGYPDERPHGRYAGRPSGGYESGSSGISQRCV